MNIFDPLLYRSLKESKVLFSHILLHVDVSVHKKRQSGAHNSHFHMVQGRV
jgi:hypothetical protein